jgi:hypothetical protein
LIRSSVRSDSAPIRRHQITDQVLAVDPFLHADRRIADSGCSCRRASISPSSMR